MNVAVAEIGRYWRKARRIPPKVLIQRVAAKLWEATARQLLRMRDKHGATYASSTPDGPLARYFETMRSVHPLTLRPIVSNYLEHRFDLLGSGWTNVRHGMRCRGVFGHSYEPHPAVEPDGNGHWLVGRINSANISESQRIWRLLDGAYVPIDWQLDFKSGYRWREATWYRDITYGHVPGADVKVPWELGRLQHLPQLAIAYGMASSGSDGLSAPKRYQQEFRNQVVDFLASNPPRYGVNWACTMDVAIRAANLLVAFDLFQAHGARFDLPFERLFLRAIHEHGRHIVTNLEWSPHLRANHYLADITGLLFVAAYLPATAESDVWLAFSAQELVDEVKTQFLQDGANFEASTSYHRLSAEMVVYSTALLLGLPPQKAAALQTCDSSRTAGHSRLRPAPLSLSPVPLADTSRETQIQSPFPEWYFERVEKMAEFTMHITKPTGSVPQIGDNDSGRFLKITPSYRRRTVREVIERYENLHGYADFSPAADYWDEDHLDHRELVAAINGLFGRSDLAAFAGDFNAVTHAIRNIAKIGNIRSYTLNKPVAASVWTSERCHEMQIADLAVPTDPISHTFSFPGSSLLDGLLRYAYPDFGLFIYRSKRLYLTMRAGTVGQAGYGGHAHNDQLSLELQVDGVDIICDPGTGLYTPMPAMRNRYRSIHAHFAPAVDKKEPTSLEVGLFLLGDEIRGECLVWEKLEIICQSVGGPSVTRRIGLQTDRIVIADYCGKPGSSVLSQSTPLPYSPGYGQVLRV